MLRWGSSPADTYPNGSVMGMGRPRWPVGGACKIWCSCGFGLMMEQERSSQYMLAFKCKTLGESSGCCTSIGSIGTPATIQRVFDTEMGGFDCRQAERTEYVEALVADL